MWDGCPFCALLYVCLLEHLYHWSLFIFPIELWAPQGHEPSGPKDRGDLVHLSVFWHRDKGTWWYSEKETPCTSELGGEVALHRVSFRGIYCTGARVRDTKEKPSPYGPAWVSRAEGVMLQGAEATTEILSWRLGDTSYVVPWKFSSIYPQNQSLPTFCLCFHLNLWLYGGLSPTTSLWKKS